jgi:hypothetical protein
MDWAGVIAGGLVGGVGVTVATPVARIAGQLDEHDLSVQMASEDLSRRINDEGFLLAAGWAKTWAEQRARRVPTASIQQHDDHLYSLHVERRRMIDAAGHRLYEAVAASEKVRALLAVQERWWHRSWRRVFRGGQGLPLVEGHAQAAAEISRWREDEETFARGAGEFHGDVVPWMHNPLID